MGKLTDKLNFSFNTGLPVILQSEAAECGLACLVMMAAYFGRVVDLASLRNRYQVSLRGATLKNIMSVADKLNMTSRPLRLELCEVGNLKLPCIIHWDLNHFVVLKKIKGRTLIVHDPARGVRSFKLNEFGEHFTGIALELTPTCSFERKREVRKLRLSDLWTRITGLKRVLGQVFLLSLTLQLFAIVTPFYMQLVVDDVLVSSDGELLSVLAIGFSLLMALNAGVWLLRSLLLIYLSSQVSIQIAANLFRHLIRLPLAWFQSRHIGDVVSRFGSLNHIKEFLTSGVIEALVDGLMVVGTLAMMFWYSPLLTSIVCFVTLLYMVVRILLFPSMRRLTEEAITALAREESNFMETVRSTQSVKLFGKETQRQSVWSNLYTDALNAAIRESRFKLGYETINRLLFGGERVLVIYLAALQVIEGAFSVGMLFAFMAYREQFSGRAGSLVDKLIQFKLLELHLGRLADITHTPAEDDLSAGPPRRLRGHVRLERITFGYDTDRPPILDGLSFEIRPGESVAIAGASGSGKSSLLKLMLGFLQPFAGTISVDGTDIKSIGLREFRARVGAVLQEDQLLSGTIADNICFFETDADQERIQQAARVAVVHDDIMKMPMGYGSLIGDMGNALSGGQKQRILLARALYRHPDILLLDEATAHLDPVTEKQVNENIRAMRLTRVIIAHRQETLLSADRVLILNRGRVREVRSGTDYKTLLACRP